MPGTIIVGLDGSLESRAAEFMDAVVPLWRRLGLIEEALA